MTRRPPLIYTRSNCYNNGTECQYIYHNDYEDYDPTSTMIFEEGGRVHPALIFESVIISLSAIVGLLGNTSVAYLILFRRRLRRSITNLYILNRAITDIISQLTTPFLVAAIANQSFVFGPVMCTILSNMVQLSILASSLFLAFMAIDWYVRGRPKQRSPTYRFTIFKVLTSFVCVLCGLLIIPVYFLTEYNEQGNIVHCVEGPLFHHPNPWGVRSLLIMIFFGIPLTLTWVFIYLDIPSKNVEALRARSTTDGEAQVEGSLPEIVKSRFLVIALAAAFTVCQLPYWLTHFAAMYRTLRVHLFYAMVSLVDVNEAINPIIYLACSSDLRRELINIFPRRSSMAVPLQPME